MQRRRFAVRDVCMFLGVKPHVLRYWEKEVPLLAPRKSVSGHREYTISDLEVLFRIHHLLYKKGFTLAGVRRQLWEESTNELQDQKARFTALRVELVDLAERCSVLRRRLDQCNRSHIGG